MDGMLVVLLLLVVVAVAMIFVLPIRQKSEPKPAVKPSENDYFGFPSAEVAQKVIDRISTANQGSFNVPCPFCRVPQGEPKPKWEVLGLSDVKVGVGSSFQSILLSCPRCASLRQVNPFTVGVADIGEDGQLNWTFAE